MKTGEGSKIGNTIEDMTCETKPQKRRNLLVTNARHENLLRQAQTSLEDAIGMIRREEALDFVEVDVNSSYGYLGEIIGETVGEDILDAVFSRFCLGK